MLVHHRAIPGTEFAGTHLYTWVERGTVKVKCLAQEHNSVFLGKAPAWTTMSCSRVEHTNHGDTMPPSDKVLGELLGYEDYLPAWFDQLEFYKEVQFKGLPTRENKLYSPVENSNETMGMV